MEYNSFEEMPVWQKAMDLAVKIYSLTERLPKKEDFSLTSQIRGSGLSVSGNIAEGFGRKHTKVGYFNKVEFEQYSNLIKEIWKELNSLINSLSRKS